MKKLHIICAKCGSDNLMLIINRYVCEDAPDNVADIFCHNCKELTGIDEWAEHNNKSIHSKFRNTEENYTPKVTKEAFNSYRYIYGSKKREELLNLLWGAVLDDWLKSYAILNASTSHIKTTTLIRKEDFPTINGRKISRQDLSTLLQIRGFEVDDSTKGNLLLTLDKVTP